MAVLANRRDERVREIGERLWGDVLAEMQVALPAKPDHPLGGGIHVDDVPIEVGRTDEVVCALDQLNEIVPGLLDSRQRFRAFRANARDLGFVSGTATVLHRGLPSTGHAI